MDMEDVQYTRLKAEFIHFKNTLRRSINAAKRLYYLRTFVFYRNDIKQTWSVIKDTLQKKLHSAPSNKFILNNATITDPDEIAKEFNKYFINIGRALYQMKFSPYTPTRIIYLNTTSQHLTFLLIM